jgi:hypothetical protein
MAVLLVPGKTSHLFGSREQASATSCQKRVVLSSSTSISIAYQLERWSKLAINSELSGQKFRAGKNTATTGGGSNHSVHTFPYILKKGAYYTLPSVINNK